MAALFADLPEAIDNTVEIARRCSYYPEDPQPDPAALRRRRCRRRRRGGEGRGRRTGAPGARRAGRAACRARADARASREEHYRERLDFELSRHREDEVSRLFPDRRRLHQMGEGAGHSGRTRPRLGRRLAGRLCDDHHRHRPAALLAAVRALPQSRPRVDARLRHRLLPGPPRRGDPLRPGEIRPRPGRARSSPSERCRRAPCCATSAASCRCPTARSTGCARWCRRTRPIR